MSAFACGVGQYVYKTCPYRLIFSSQLVTDSVPVAVEISPTQFVVSMALGFKHHKRECFKHARSRHTNWT